MTAPGLPDPEHDEPPPLLGSWPALYAAVTGWAVLCLALTWLFTVWRF